MEIGGETSKNHILFIKVSHSSFINADEKLLRNHFPVDTYFYGTDKGFKAGIAIIKMMMFLLLNIRKYALIYIWFADYHSLVPSLFSYLFRKKTIIVLGGFDVAKIPNLKYGAHTKKMRSLFVKASCYFADGLIAVSQFVKDEAIINIGTQILSKIIVIYNAIDVESYVNTHQDRNNQVLCISAAQDMNRAYIKGIDRFVNLAQQMPNYNFVLVGVTDPILMDKLGINKVKNIECFSFMKKKDLLQMYNISKVIFQLSIVESFGLAVVEAMSCGCVPVVANVGGLREIVDQDFGYKVDRMDDKQIQTSIIQVFNTFITKSQLAQRTVLNRFSIKEREKKILDFISDL